MQHSLRTLSASCGPSSASAPGWCCVLRPAICPTLIVWAPSCWKLWRAAETPARVVTGTLVGESDLSQPVGSLHPHETQLHSVHGKTQTSTLCLCWMVGRVKRMFVPDHRYHLQKFDCHSTDKEHLHMTTAVDIIIPLSPLSYTVPKGKSISTIRCKERRGWTPRSPDTSCSAAVLGISDILKKRHPWRIKRSMKMPPDPSTT